MPFNSLEFAIFLPIVLGVYALVGFRSQNLWLLAASYTFYGWWDWRFLSLIMISTTADYLLAHRMSQCADVNRRRYLWMSLGINLGLLGTFKYFNFFIDSFIELGATIGLNLDTPALRLVPPVGISFYTFQTLSYTIDVYRKEIKPERNFITFAVFVAYFPQLVAGPIERASRLLPQINAPRRITVECLRSGAVLILIGLFKKVVIADSAGAEVNAIFADAADASSLVLAVGAVLFTLQIYGDFSGYSNIARGVSRLLGIRLVENFKTPYFARNVSDFWRRWHISLSEWLRDYLYIGLGGNRSGKWQTIRNLMATMVLGGLWHGAAWTFVVWGALHGLYLGVHRIWQHWRSTNQTINRKRIPGSFDIGHKLYVGLCIVLTYIVVSVAFVVFRAQSIQEAWFYLAGIVELRGNFSVSVLQLPILLIAMLAPIDLIQYRHNGKLLAIRDCPLLMRSCLYAAMALSILLASHQDIPFIYFQF